MVLIKSANYFELEKKLIIKKSRNYRDFYNNKIVDYLLLSLILAFLPVSSLK